MFSGAHWFNGGVRSLILGHVINPIYKLLNMLYQMIIDIAQTPVLSGQLIYDLFDRVQLIIAVFMIFRIMVQVIQMIVSPDKGKSDEGHIYGATRFFSLIKRVLLGLVLLILLRPVSIPGATSTKSGGQSQLNSYVNNHGVIFGIMYDLQYRILTNNNIGCLITNTNCNPGGMNENDETMSEFVDYLITSFVHPNTDKEDETEDEDASEDLVEETNNNLTTKAYNSGLVFLPNASNKDDNKILQIEEEKGEVQIPEEYKDKSNWTCGSTTKYYDDYISGRMEASDFLSEKVYKEECGIKNGEFTFKYNYIILLLLLVVLIYFMGTFLIDVAFRSIKLTYLRLISPIPVIAYMSDANDIRLNNWSKSVISTYVDLFIRLALLFLGFSLISQFKSGTVLSDESAETYTKIFIVIALFIFIKKAPELTRQLLGLNANSDFGIGNKTVKAIGGVPAAAVGAVRQGGGFKDAWDATTAQAKENIDNLFSPNPQPFSSLRQSYIGGKDLMARRLTGNPNATAKKMRQGARRAEAMGFNENLDEAYNRVAEAENNYNNSMAQQRQANDMYSQYTANGWNGLTDDQKDNAINSLTNNSDKNRYQQIMNNATDGVIQDDDMDDFNRITRQAVIDNQRSADESVRTNSKELENAKDNLSRWLDFEDNVMINRTPEFANARESNPILGTAGRNFGATGSPRNIKYGRHGNNRVPRESKEYSDGV